MSEQQSHPYATHLDVKFAPLSVVDVPALVAACRERWYNQTLCKVNDSVIRLGVLQGEYHWHEHDNDDEFFFVLEGHLIIDLEGRCVDLQPLEGFVVHTGTRARGDSDGGDLDDRAHRRPLSAARVSAASASLACEAEFTEASTQGTSMGTRASSRHLRLIPSPAHPDAAEQEFPVRFTPAADRLAWLRRPANAFGWVGSGTLRFESAGVQITARRLTLGGLRRQQRLIQRDEIRDVYRESNLVQLTLRGAGRPGVLRFWAADVAQAVELVARLPTHRAIELESPLGFPGRPGRRSRRSALWLLALSAAIFVGLAWLRVSRLGPPPPAVQPSSPAAPVMPEAREQALRRLVTGASEAEVEQARADIGRFSERFAGLRTQFGTAFDALLAGDLSQQQFASGLDQWLRPQWDLLARQLPSGGSMRLRALADQELAGVIVNWQRALTRYAHGLRTQNPREVDTAFDAMRAAEEHERSAWQLLGDLERRPGGAGGAAVAPRSSR